MDDYSKVIEAIDKKALDLLERSTLDAGVIARAVLDLAEARAWLSMPGQPHGGRGASGS